MEPAFWLNPGDQRILAFSIPALVSGSIVLVLERLSAGGEPLLLLRHQAAPRIDAWERRRGSVLRAGLDAVA